MTSSESVVAGQLSAASKQLAELKATHSVLGGDLQAHHDRLAAATKTLAKFNGIAKVNGIAGATQQLAQLEAIRGGLARGLLSRGVLGGDLQAHHDRLAAATKTLAKFNGIAKVNGIAGATQQLAQLEAIRGGLARGLLSRGVLGGDLQAHHDRLAAATKTLAKFNGIAKVNGIAGATQQLAQLEAIRGGLARGLLSRGVLGGDLQAHHDRLAAATKTLAKFNGIAKVNGIAGATQQLAQLEAIRGGLARGLLSRGVLGGDLQAHHDRLAAATKTLAKFNGIAKVNGIAGATQQLAQLEAIRGGLARGLLSRGVLGGDLQAHHDRLAAATKTLTPQLQLAVATATQEAIWRLAGTKSTNFNAALRSLARDLENQRLVIRRADDHDQVLAILESGTDSTGLAEVDRQVIATLAGLVMFSLALWLYIAHPKTYEALSDLKDQVALALVVAAATYKQLGPRY